MKTKTCLLLALLSMTVLINQSHALTVTGFGIERYIYGESYSSLGAGDYDEFTYLNNSFGNFNATDNAASASFEYVEDIMCLPGFFGGPPSCFVIGEHLESTSAGAQASQVSTLANTGSNLAASAEGASSGYLSDYDSSLTAVSYFEFYFTIDEAAPYSLLAMTFDGASIGFARLDIYDHIISYTDSIFDISMSGMLNAGTYYLGIAANSDYYTSYSNEDFVLNFTVGNASQVPSVPEPSTFVLLGVGLAGLAAMGARRKKS